MKIPHVMLIPYPAQGHVIPLMELALHLVNYGCKVTFVNTQFIHERVIKALSLTDNIQEIIQMVSIPDGLESSDDRSDLGKEIESVSAVMPGELMALIALINSSEKKMGVKKVAFWPQAALLALLLKIPNLIDDGIIDSDDMPAVNTKEHGWNCFSDELTGKITFKLGVQIIKPVKSADRMICNSSNWLESGTFASFPELIPVGPLLASNRLGKSVGNFWKEDSGCLAWLDQHPPNSENIIEDVNNAYPMGFNERVHHQGRIVSWAPQKKVLSHPSVACFISHCGWSSTIEGISNGIPFLCWPYFTDQLFDGSYICDYLKIGLGFNKDDSGIIRGAKKLRTNWNNFWATKDLEKGYWILKQRFKIVLEKEGARMRISMIS
ncbi:UDP-glycosyltransferase 83A1-like [Olea europaea subsp. europaea]|uniref:UDP-glycosyltransferase 83A1-like n=1 Tax=Olea europaea subsp. europaea TaxID=158383 RepID=A0A8S0QKW5_OLEEU|nr:UDP-glycosyltransferase 83A1-like [Olea europaea subsp. europaea]